MKELGLPRSAELASELWKIFSPSEKDKYGARHRKALKSPHVPELPDHLHEDEGLVNNAVSLDPTPVMQVEQLPASPLFSESGSSASEEPPAAGPSVLVQPPSAGPSPVVLELPLPGPSSAKEAPVLGPSSSTDQPSFAAFSAVASASDIPLSAPIPTRPLPENFLDNLLDETAYNYLASSHPTSAFDFPELGDSWSDLFSEVPPIAVTTGINESYLPTPVPTTPTTGHHSLGLVTPGYTPRSHIQDLPTALDNNQFGFNGVETVVSGQMMWNTLQDFGFGDQQPTALPDPAFSFPAPVPVPAPALAPFPPPVAGQSNQMTGFPGDWNDIARVLGSDQPQPAPAPVPQQSVPLVQQVIDAVNANGLGANNMPFLVVPLGGMQLWLAGK